MPDVGVPLRADQLVEVVESRKLGFGEQRPVGPPFHLPQLLPHALLAELVQNVLNLQHSLQAPLLSLIALQLLPPRRLLHRLLDLNGGEKKGRGKEKKKKWLGTERLVWQNTIDEDRNYTEPRRLKTRSSSEAPGQTPSCVPPPELWTKRPKINT